MQDEDYSSDTSDEDFIIEGENQSSGSDTGNESDAEAELRTDANLKKRRKGVSKKKTKNKNPLLEKVAEGFSPREEEQPIEDNSNIKEKADSLWADFLADVDDKPPSPPKPKSNSWASLLGKNSSTSQKASLKESLPKKKTENSISELSDTPTTVKVTKIFEFAGEEVRVEEEMSAESAEAKEAELKASVQSGEDKRATKRPVGAAGIVSFLDNKKKKLTTLEKTKLDWDNFKEDRGLKEQLESHKKSKAGYLDKQAFLERVDLRQFEIERDMRMSRRSKR